MPVFNTEEKFLREAIDSILCQTYTNFEFIIIDDASNKETQSILEYYENIDKRIMLIKNGTNLGITKNLNKGFKVAKGKYIARMDADDISVNGRLEKQLKYMEGHPDVVVLGGCAKLIGDVDNYPNLFGYIGMNFDQDRELRKIRLSINNDGVIHPTAFIRKELMDKNNLYYDEKILKAQDYELWTRCIEYGKIVVLPEVLLKYRVHEGQISIQASDKQKRFKDIVRIRMLKKLGEFSQNEKKILLTFCDLNYQYSYIEYSKLLNKMIKINSKIKVYNPKKYRKEMIYRLIILLKQKNFIEIFKEKQIFYPSMWIYFMKLEICKINRYLFVKELMKK